MSKYLTDIKGRHLFVEVTTSAGSEPRPATKEEITNCRSLRHSRRVIEVKIDRLKEQLRNLPKCKCVCYDEPGAIYDIRTCIGCGVTNTI